MLVKTMQEILEDIDDEIFRLGDKSLYVVKVYRNATVTTLLEDVSFRRRYYIDKPEADYECLLDEVLEFGGERIGPALKVVAATQAVAGPSYSAARDSLERFYGHRVLSHEGIRQIVLKVGKMIEKDVNVRNRCDGETPGKKVPNGYEIRYIVSGRTFVHASSPYNFIFAFIKSSRTFKHLLGNLIRNRCHFLGKNCVFRNAY